MDFFEKTIESHYIFKGNILNLRFDKVVMHNGNIATREIVEHNGGVGVVPVDKDGNIYLVEQFRKPYEKNVLEIPAGKLNINENHSEAGRRELKEETGFSAGKFEYLTHILPSPGYCCEIIHIYLARDLKPGNLNLDEDEFLNVIKMPFNQAVNEVLKGNINDAKTVSGILMANELLNRTEV